MIIVSKSSVGFLMEFSANNDNFDVGHELFELCYNTNKINNDDRKSFFLTFDLVSI